MLFLAIAIFAPLADWSKAVLAGDRATLSQFYRAKSDAQAEIDFWMALKASGLTDLNPKILSMKDEAGNARQLVLRIQGTESGQKIVIGAAQVWQQDGGAWRIVASQRSTVSSDMGRRLPEPAKPNPQLYAPPGEAQAELKAALATAGREHKRVIVVFGANWCYDCHVLDATFRSKEFAPLVQANYIVLHINTGDEGKDNTDLAARLGVNLDHGIPALAVLNADGSVVEAQKNGEFESTTRIGPADVRAFLEKWKK